MAKKKKGSPIFWIILLVIIVVILLIVFGRAKKDRTIKVVVEDAIERTIIETVYASGKLFPATEVEITSNISGTIVELLVEEGQSVKEGDLLAKIDPDALASMVERAEASANSARAQLENIKAQKAQLLVQLNNAEINYNRNQELFTEGVISRAELDVTETTYKSTLAQVEALDKSILSAQFNVKSSDATVKEQRKNLSQTSIFAPMSGIVSKLYKKKGEQVVGTIQMAGTPILNIANLNLIEVRVDVNERDILNVENGDTADIELDAYPDEKFKGIVTRIANTANNLSASQLTSDQVTNFEVRILMSQESYKNLQKTADRSPFRAGLSASVEIRTNTLNNILTVPITAVTAKEDEVEKNKREDQENNKKAENTEKTDARSSKELKEYVFLQQADTVKLQLVETGIQDDEFIQIKKGLNANQKIVVAPYEAISKKLKQGKKVTVVEEEELYSKDKTSWK